MESRDRPGHMCSTFTPLDGQAEPKVVGERGVIRFRGRRRSGQVRQSQLLYARFAHKERETERADGRSMLRVWGARVGEERNRHRERATPKSQFQIREREHTTHREG